MTHEKRRCWHCQVLYLYQGIGDGCFDPDNNHDYCPDCMDVINAALDKVPVKVSKIMVPTQDYTMKELLEIDEKQTQARIAAGGFPMRKMVPGLCRHTADGGLESETTRCVYIDGREYHLRYWKIEDAKIYVAREMDARTRVIGDYWWGG